MDLSDSSLDSGDFFMHFGFEEWVVRCWFNRFHLLPVIVRCWLPERDQFKQKYYKYNIIKNKKNSKKWICEMRCVDWKERIWKRDWLRFNTRLHKRMLRSLPFRMSIGTILMKGSMLMLCQESRFFAHWINMMQDVDGQALPNRFTPTWSTRKRIGAMEWFGQKFEVRERILIWDMFFLMVPNLRGCGTVSILQRFALFPRIRWKRKVMENTFIYSKKNKQRRKAIGLLYVFAWLWEKLFKVIQFVLKDLKSISDGIGFGHIDSGLF